jgi:hypothetical protein
MLDLRVVRIGPNWHVQALGRGTLWLFSRRWRLPWRRWQTFYVHTMVNGGAVYVLTAFMRERDAIRFCSLIHTAGFVRQHLQEGESHA